MVLWQSPDTPFLSCFLVSHALSCLSALFHVGAWCSNPGTLVLFQAQFWFRVWVWTLMLQVWYCCGSMRSRVCSGCALLCPCAFVVFVLISLVLSCSCLSQLVFFTGCVLSCLSCFVWTRGLWVSLLAACSCPVLPPCHWNASRSAGWRGCISPVGGRWCCSPASGGRRSCSAPSGGRRSCPALGDGGGTGVRLLPPFKAWRLFQSPIQSGSPQSPIQSENPQSPLHPSSWPCRLHPSSLPCRLHPSSLPCRLHPSSLLWRLRPCFLSYRGCPSCLQSFWLCPGLLTGLLTCLSLPGLSLRPCPGRPPGLQNCWSPLGSTLPSHPGPS